MKRTDPSQNAQVPSNRMTGSMGSRWFQLFHRQRSIGVPELLVLRQNAAFGTLEPLELLGTFSYCQVILAPNRMVRGQPIWRSGVLAVSYSVSRMFSTATKALSPLVTWRLTVASHTAY